MELEFDCDSMNHVPAAAADPPPKYG